MCTSHLITQNIQMTCIVFRVQDLVQLVIFTASSFLSKTHISPQYANVAEKTALLCLSIVQMLT